MMLRMQEYTLERCTISKGELLEDIKTWRPVKKIQAAISVSTGSTQELNQIQRITSTHIAITADEVKTGDRFGGYSVDFVIPGRRFNQLFLTREAVLHEGKV